MRTEPFFAKSHTVDFCDRSIPTSRLTSTTSGLIRVGSRPALADEQHSLSNHGDLLVASNGPSVQGRTTQRPLARRASSMKGSS